MIPQYNLLGLCTLEGNSFSIPLLNFCEAINVPYVEGTLVPPAILADALPLRQVTSSDAVASYLMVEWNLACILMNNSR